MPGPLHAKGGPPTARQEADRLECGELLVHSHHAVSEAEHKRGSQVTVQHYGAPNPGNWASHYWAYSCGTTIQHPTNGPT